MLKALLAFSMAFPFAAANGQSFQTDWPEPSEVITVDPNMLVADLAVTVVENAKVALRWRVDGDLPEFFAIERSGNGKDFEVMTVLNNLTTLPLYRWTDEAPLKGRSFYRIRYAFPRGGPLYSKTLMASVAGDIAFKFYPNPVDHILIVRSEQPLDVQIVDANGRIRIAEGQVQGLRTINVSGLEKGIYLIRFSSKLINVISQEKLIKN